MTQIMAIKKTASVQVPGRVFDKLLLVDENFLVSETIKSSYSPTINKNYCQKNRI